MQTFESHNEHVRSVVPKSNLLEFRAPDGWGPLCDFLGKPVPNEPYPHLNDGSMMIARQKLATREVLKKVSWRIANIIGLGIVIGGVLIYLFSS